MMKRAFLSLLILPLLGAVSLAAEADTTKTIAALQPADSNQVAVVRYTWVDAKRHRDVPVKIYYPKTGGGRIPVTVFSHGLGGSREGYEYLGNYWASHGYVSVHLQHIGSDDSVWKGLPPEEIMPALRQAVLAIHNSVNRPLDVKFVLDQLEKFNQGDT